jgi:nitrate reductase gamma subunit
MEGLLDFARGPLFRFSFIIMILGLARILFIDLFNAWTAYRKAGDKSMPWKLVISRSLEWLIPVKRIGHNRPVYSVISIIFHVGLLLVPIFLLAHVQLWKGALGVYWPTLSYKVAYWLTMSTIIAGTFLIIGRIFNSTSSFLSRKQDFLWPIILLVPFVTGFVCANVAVSPGNYKLLMLIHVLAGDLIFMLIPFTKIAHCVLMPLSQFISTLAWKFPPETDDAIATTLKKKGAPV